MAGMMEGFNKIHAKCKPTWKEPEAPQLSETQRAYWWMTNGEIGESSKSIWAYFMGQKELHPNHPYDPDDFKRCYKLFKALPEWRARVTELKCLSDVWERLSMNWDKLTEMYEENERTNWKKYKEIGMYEFMKTLIQ